MPTWLTSTDSSVWLWLDRVSIVLSYAVVLSILAFVFNVFRYRRKRKELIEIEGKTALPKALCLSFGGGSIKLAVSDYLKETYPDRKIAVSEYKGDEVTPQNVHKHEEEIRKLKERYQSKGVTELHLFMKGPLGLALAVGAIFDNWVAVKIYQNNREGSYEPWTALHHAKAVPIADIFAEKIIQAVEPND